MLIIFATIMSISDPTGDLTPGHALLWLAIWRIVLGVGVGGDYPMSASITSDRAHLKRRGKHQLLNALSSSVLIGAQVPSLHTSSLTRDGVRSLVHW